MQNRSLIYIVCVVAIASLALLVIPDQGFVQRDLRRGAEIADRAEHQTAMMGMNSSPVDNKRFVDAKSKGSNESSDFTEVFKTQETFPSTATQTLSHSNTKGSANTLPLDGWSHLENQELFSSSESMNWATEDTTSEIAVVKAASEVPATALTQDFKEKKTAERLGNFERNAAKAIAQKNTSMQVVGMQSDVVASVATIGTVATRASLVDRPGDQPSSTIMQVQNQEPTGSTDEEEEAQQLGVPPPKRTPAFLKKRSILLEPGQYQFEYGLRYSVDNNSYALTGLLQDGTNSVQVINASQKRQLVSSPLEMRFGIQENLQGFITLPIGWSAQSLTASNSQSQSDIFGIGDLGIGLTRVLWAPEKAKTRFLGFCQASAPIGGGEISLSQQDRDASLGAGYWTLTTGANVTESIDPLILFGSFGYTHTFGTRIPSGNYIDVGNTIFYQVGVGYGINPYVTLSGSFSGASSGRIRLDDTVAAGTRSEPFSLRLSASVNKPNDGTRSKLGTNYEPFLRFGLTSLANDVEFGIRWTY